MSALSETAANRHVVVVGLGYVGCVTAACLAKLGHRVIGVDCHSLKVEAVSSGRAPFYEPGLDEIVKANVAAGRLSASTNLAEAIAHSDIVLICVGTPTGREGKLGLEQLHRVSCEIGECLPQRRMPLIVAVRSTVLPGTCEEVVAPALGHPARALVVSNPEFLREGAAVRDFLETSLVVVGGSDPKAVSSVAGLYGPLGIQPCLVSLRTAEFIKYACNAFHALKIAFANEVGALGAGLGIDAGEVMDMLCRDHRLNISPAYLKPGFAFGGSCLPKDQRALVYRALRLGLRLPLIESILPSNQEHLARAVRRALDLPADRIGVFGLAFKEDTDDLRESPAVALLETLIAKGRNLRVFDPQIQLDRIHGANRQFVLDVIPHIGSLLDSSLDDLLSWAQHLILAQKPAPEFVERIRRSEIPVLDLMAAFAEPGPGKPSPDRA
jgi:GDP-mannose 6-dehydrogenase